MQIEGVQVQQEDERIFTDFLASENITNPKDYTLNIDKLRAQHPHVAQQVIRDPSKYYVVIKKHLEKQAQESSLKKKAIVKVQHYDIKIEGNLGANFVTPRGLSSRLANELVGLQGIITKMQISQAYLQKSVHYCQKTKAMEMRQYPDSFNPEKDNDVNRSRFIRSYDDNNNPMEFEYGLSSFKDTQLVVIQELPQMAPPGLLPMSVQVVMQANLVNTVKPGDRVQMIGIYKLISGLNAKQKGIFRPFFICMSVKPLTQVYSLNKRPPKLDFPKEELFDLFARSIAPSVWGHQYLKKAVLLMLAGGVEKVLDNGTHLRGDINLLMIGDPGTAKSQMLRWVLSTVDVSVGTTGSGASGVGLTAAIVSDKLTGEKTLEAGAMVLADRGVVCIDQFDKMNEIDRVAVHEVMEQQTVTIAKAGMLCSLNARCSVIAAANPIYGQYQSNLPPTKNIGMPDSLLSRFDLIFIILDQKDSARDNQIAEKVCKNHRLAPQSNGFFNQYMDSDDYVVSPIQESKVDESVVFEKNNVYKGEGRTQILAQSYLKKYLNHIKQTVTPDLSDNAVELIASLWTLLRQKDANDREQSYTKVLPVTIRTQESLIRLATAHAKILQSTQVEVYNVLEAFRLVVYCLFSDQNALADEISEILLNLNIDYDYKAHMANKKPVPRRQQEQIKMEKREQKMEEEQIRNKMEKMNFRQNERQADEVLENHVEVKFKQQEKTLVYKKIVDLKRKKKGNDQQISFDQLFDEVKNVLKNKKKLQAILEDLQTNSKIGTENGKIFMI